MELFDPYKEVVTECAPHIDDDKNGGVCSSKKVIEKISDIIVDVPAEKPADIIETAKVKLACDTEACVLEKLADSAASDSAREIFKRELAERFKLDGPADTTVLFNNSDIDETLEQWKKKFNDFMHIDFQFIDFPKYNTLLETLNIGKAYEAGFRTIGCVLNTDSTGGRGKHWICIFIDMRNPDLWTIEFFNSSGNPPHENVLKWQERIKAQMNTYFPNVDAKVVRVTAVKHQKSNTECGPYCMYYIWNRLNGVPYEKFSVAPIDDHVVTEFRKHLFR